MNMPTSEVIEILAERDGWTDRGEGDGEWSHLSRFRHPTRPSQRDLPDYLNSRDALAHVLAKLTPEEFRILERLLEGAYPMSHPTWIHFLLTIPPQTLAPMIALAIKEAKGK